MTSTVCGPVRVARDAELHAAPDAGRIAAGPVEEVPALIGQVSRLVVCEGDEGVEEQDVLVPGPVEPPLAGDEAVDQERSDVAGDPTDRSRIDDPTPLRMRQRDVVVLRQEADQRGSLRIV